MKLSKQYIIKVIKEETGKIFNEALGDTQVDVGQIVTDEINSALSALDDNHPLKTPEKAQEIMNMVSKALKNPPEEYLKQLVAQAKEEQEKQVKGVLAGKTI